MEVDMQRTQTQRAARAESDAWMEERSFADVDDSSADSFPASDPPSWASMRVGAPSAGTVPSGASD
jgi:hypothetical protein